MAVPEAKRLGADLSERIKHWRPWSEMLEAPAARREARGEPPAPPIHDDEYWLERAKHHKEFPRRRRDGKVWTELKPNRKK